MKLLFLFFVFVLIYCDMFEEFVVKYEKPYQNDLEEMTLRRSIFFNNLRKFRRLNQQYPETEFGVNKFADLTEEEFLDLVLCNLEVPELSFGEKNPEPRPTPKNIPPDYDWRDHDGVTPIRDQKACGACWAFATVSNAESAIVIAGAAHPDELNIAEQYLLSCNSDGYSCDGGWFANEYFINKKISEEVEVGTVYEEEMPYTAADDPCNGPHTHHEKFKHWDYIDPYVAIPNPDQVKDRVYNHGPVAVAVCVNTQFQGYKSGIFTGGGFCPQVNHAVNIVGWGVGVSGNNEYWIMRNSWGTGWGIDGYMHISYTANQIGYGANYIIY